MAGFLIKGAQDVYLTENATPQTPSPTPSYSDQVLVQFSVRTDAMCNYNRTDVFDHCLMTTKKAQFFQTAHNLMPQMKLLFWFGYDLSCRLEDIKITVISDQDDIKAFARLYPDGIRSEHLSEFLEWEIMRSAHQIVHGDQCETFDCELDEPEYDSCRPDCPEDCDREAPYHTELFEQFAEISQNNTDSSP